MRPSQNSNHETDYFPNNVPDIHFSGLQKKYSSFMLLTLSTMYNIADLNLGPLVFIEVYQLTFRIPIKRKIANDQGISLNETCWIGSNFHTIVL